MYPNHQGMICHFDRTWTIFLGLLTLLVSFVSCKDYFVYFITHRFFFFFLTFQQKIHFSGIPNMCLVWVKQVREFPRSLCEKLHSWVKGVKITCLLMVIDDCDTPPLPSHYIWILLIVEVVIICEEIVNK